MVGVVGLGKMGLNFAFNLSDKGYEVVGYDVEEPEGDLSFNVSSNLEELVIKLQKPRKIILMLPAGEITNNTITVLSDLLDEDDIVVDAGNSYYKDSLRNYEKLQSKHIHFLDCGTSGGVEGARFGACLMIGGDKKPFNQVEDIFKALSVKDGYQYTGQPGTGHFTKMVHNGIEYGMMQSIAEGLNIIHRSDFDIDLKDVTGVWDNGSIIASYLMKITNEIFIEESDLSAIHKRIDSSGEGKWTLMEALDLGVATPTISAAMNVRNISSDDHSINNQIVASMRNKFGGHYIHKERDND